MSKLCCRLSFMEKEFLEVMEKSFWLLQNGKAVTQGPSLPGKTTRFRFVANWVSPVYMVNDFMRFPKLKALLNFEFHVHECAMCMNTDIILYVGRNVPVLCTFQIAKRGGTVRVDTGFAAGSRYGRAVGRRC